MGGAIHASNTSKENAQKNREFQLYMSNTAYQRAMDSMRDAGLNPMLAYSQGGASTGSGSMAQTPDFASAFGDIGHSAASALQLRSQLKNDKAERKLKAAQTAATLTTAKSVKVQTELDESKLPGARASEEFYKASPWMRWIKNTRDSFFGKGSSE